MRIPIHDTLRPLDPITIANPPWKPQPSSVSPQDTAADASAQLAPHRPHQLAHGHGLGEKLIKASRQRALSLDGGRVRRHRQHGEPTS